MGLDTVSPDDSLSPRMAEREHRINVRATPEEADMLRQLSERDGISQSDWIRMMIRRSFAELSAPKPRPRKK